MYALCAGILSGQLAGNHNHVLQSGSLTRAETLFQHHSQVATPQHVKQEIALAHAPC